MGNITFREKNLFYADKGTGTPLVLIHGFCEDNTIWDSFVKFLPNDVRIIRPDLPGFGKSELPDGEISIDTYADALYEILKKEDINKCLIVGHSMGGYTVLAFAAKYPEMLTGMALFHSFAFADDDNKKQDRLRAIDFVNKNGVEIYIDELYPKLFAPDFYSKNKEFILQLKKHAYRFSSGGITAAINAMRERPDRTGVLKNSQVPVLFIVGKQDNAILFEKSHMHFALPNVSQIVILDDVAHMGMFEATEECAKEIAGFRLLTAY
jgi:pimeloyl-ACP methyl ester carboxylesterase